MDSLVTSFNGVELGGGIQKLSGTIKVYISEVSSPTKLWFQLAENKELDELTAAINAEGFSIKPHQVLVGMRVAAFACYQWDRAEVISEYNAAKDSIKLFFIDYGTTGYVSLKRCKFLVEQFSTPTGKAFRGAMYGIQPQGQRRLWDLKVTLDFINRIREKVHTIEIINYHSKEDFYEFLLMDGSATVNRNMIESAIADPSYSNDTLPLCLSYPTFDMLEKLESYPTFGERISMLEQTGFNLNVFEEVYIPPVTDFKGFEKELEQILSDESFVRFKEIFQNLRSR